MQQSADRQRIWRHYRIRLGIMLTIICLVVSLVLTIKFFYLANHFEYDTDRISNNKTTQDNDSNRSTTEATTRTTYFSTQITSTFNDTELNTSSISSLDRWIVDSYLVTARDRFGTVIMKNGEILVCGGTALLDIRLIYFSLCEIYSSLNRRWQAVTDMHVLRGGHTLTTLQDGKSILAVGGLDRIDTYTAEIYDLEMNRWTFVPSIMDVGRCYHTATLLENGQVLLVGGINVFDWNKINSNTQLYDPSSNTFITKGNLNTARSAHTATLLNDGMSVLITGGVVKEQDDKSTAEIYQAGFWSYTEGNMIVARSNHAAVLLLDGNVLIAGGLDNNDNALSAAEIYNSSTHMFSPVQSMACARAKLTLTLLPSGQVLAVGGHGPIIDNCPLVSELYNPIIDQWMSTRLLNSIHYDHGTVLINNSVLVIGGAANEMTSLNQCERFDL